MNDLCIDRCGSWERTASEMTEFEYDDWHMLEYYVGYTLGGRCRLVQDVQMHEDDRVMALDSHRTFNSCFVGLHYIRNRTGRFIVFPCDN